MDIPKTQGAEALQAARNRRGIAAIIVAMALFITTDTLSKVARADMPAGQVMTLRGLFAVVFALALAGAMGELSRLPMVFHPAVLRRAFAEMSVAVTFLTVLGHMPLANLTAIGQSAPLMIAVYLAISGSERMGWRRWSSVAVGFSGVLLVLKPGAQTFDAYTVLAVICAVLVAVRDLLTRSVPREVPSVLILAATTLSVLAGGLVMGLFETWAPVTGRSLALLAAAAFFVTGGNYFIITAFRGVEVGVVAPFRYTVIVMAVLYGIFVFGELPDGFTVAGALMIGASGAYTIHRERVRAREGAAG
jgi:drug/metabolite transporter (DMT)-like permease